MGKEQAGQRHGSLSFREWMEVPHDRRCNSGGDRHPSGMGFVHASQYLGVSHLAGTACATGHPNSWRNADLQDISAWQHAIRDCGFIDLVSVVVSQDGTIV